MKKCNENILFTTHNSRLTKAAFTLAETLIVIGIIGVVAALTLPNLNHATGDKETVTRVKKIYSSLNEAFDRAQATYGPIDEWFINSSDNNDRFAKRITEFMKISKDCTDSSGCFSYSYNKLNGGGNGEATDFPEIPNFSLPDGTAVGFNISSDDCSLDYATDETLSGSPQKHSCGLIFVDINGTKGKNTHGVDYFRFVITKNGIYPHGSQNSDFGKDVEALNSCFDGGVTCTGWVIEQGNMDYAKANNGVCQNGKQLDWTTNTSCN